MSPTWTRSLIAAIALAPAAVLGAGLEPAAVSGAGALAFALRGAAVDAIEASGATLAFSAELSNPTPAPVLLGGVTYALDVEGKRIFEGTVPGGAEIPAGGSAAVPFPGRVRYADLPGVALKVAAKKPVPYRLSAAAAVRTGAGDVTVPVAYEGVLSLPQPPKVGLAGLRIRSMNPFDAAVEVSVEVENPNPFPLPLGLLAYRLTVAGGEIASAEVALPVVGSGQKAVIAVPVKISLKRAGKGVVSALKGDAALVGLSGVAAIGDLSYPVAHEARLPTKR
jgi:LEA14-like dessication related protein